MSSTEIKLLINMRELMLVILEISLYIVDLIDSRTLQIGSA